MSKKRQRVLVSAPQLQFVMPYIVREFGDMDVVTDHSEGFDHAVMLSTTDVYNVVTGCDHDETTPQLSRHPMLEAEDRFRSLCGSAGVSPTVLRCPHVVGTGMTGLPREMINKIYRGSYFHIKGVDERLSVVHASDVALAARKTLDSGATLIVTDGDNPSYESLAEALVHRMGQKRIFTISERWARWRYSASMYNTLTNTLTFSSRRLQTEYGFCPTPVCTYLKTHVYDESSL